jgi:hypothetical protein
VIRTFTNMIWPDDPYGTGQLWRREPRLLAGLSVCWVGEPGPLMPTAYAAVYLKLPRVAPLDVSEGFAFGFRAAAITTAGQVSELVRMLDLDILRASRLAKIVSGYSLPGEVRELMMQPGAGRGIRSLASGISAGGGGGAAARVVDIDSGRGSLSAELAAMSGTIPLAARSVQRAFAPRLLIEAMAASACRHRRGAPLIDEHEARCEPNVAGPAEWLAACATERALVCGVSAGRLSDQLTWHEPLDIGAAMTASAWDCFSSAGSDRVPAAP